MSALPQTLGEMRRSILVVRAQRIQASRIRAGRRQAEREDIDAGDEVAVEMAIECGFLTPERERTWLGRRAVLQPDTPYAFDPVERDVVKRVKRAVAEVHRLQPQALAVLDLPASELKVWDAECRKAEAQIEAAAEQSGVTVARIMHVATAELDEEKRAAANSNRRRDRDFLRGAA